MNNAILPVDVPSLQPTRLQLSLRFTGDSFYDVFPVQATLILIFVPVQAALLFFWRGLPLPLVLA